MVSDSYSIHKNLGFQSWTERGGSRKISNALDTFQEALLLGDT